MWPWDPIVDAVMEPFAAAAGWAWDTVVEGITDWLAKGFVAVALMQIDHPRTSALLLTLAQAEQDPWEAQKYEALAEIAARESDYQRIVWQGVRAYRQIEARREEAEAQ